jgi:hypothetical protein
LEEKSGKIFIKAGISHGKSIDDQYLAPSCLLVVEDIIKIITRTIRLTFNS